MNRARSVTNKHQWIEIGEEYLRRDLSIIPIGSGKRPLVQWKHFQESKPTIEEVKTWSQMSSFEGFGAVTGPISGIVVLDLDVGADLSGLVLPNTPTVQTGSGGRHMYFRYPEDITIGNRVGLHHKIDLRGLGGYVVLPPAVHPNGTAYQWLTDLSTPFAEMPWWLVEDLREERARWNELKELQVIEGVPQSQRNDSAAKVVGSLLHRYPQDEWGSIVWPLFEGWNLKNHPPLDTRELRSVYESIAGRELDKRNGNGQVVQHIRTHHVEFVSDKVSWTETHQGLYTFGEVKMKVEAFLPNSGTALKVMLAVAISGIFHNRVMLWLLFVGAPSSGKTELVQLLKGSAHSYCLDNVTLNSFISGERPTEKQKVHDLLPELDRKCLVVKDWTVIFSLDEKMTKKIIGDMVGAYDKQLSKHSSRRGLISYESEFSHLGCITPATLNRHHNYLNMIGPRFLCYTIINPSKEEEGKSFDAIFSNQDRDCLEKQAREAVQSYVTALSEKDPLSTVKRLSKSSRDYLRIAARFVSRARGIVILQTGSFRGESGNDVTYYEPLEIQIEQPWRAAQQLMELSRYLAFICGKDEVGVEELEIVRQVVISSMPADRSQALRVILKHDGNITAKELSDESDRSNRTCRRMLDELTSLGILKKTKGSGQLANSYAVEDEFYTFICSIPFNTISDKVNTRIDELPENLRYFASEDVIERHEKGESN